VENARRLLDRIGPLTHPCDLDLLIFFARHSHTLLASEQLAVLLGYEFKQLAASLDLLVGAGFVTRTPNPTHDADMFMLAVGDATGGWLLDLLHVASTREGRLAMLGALKPESASQATPDPAKESQPDDQRSDKQRKGGGR